MPLGLYAGLLTLLYIALTFRTIGARRRAQQALGDGGDRLLQRAMRAHGNFMEYVPLGLILLFMLQQQGAASWLIHLLGSALFLGRVIHAVGISQQPEPLKLRVTGMLLTLLTLFSSALLLIINAVM